MLTLTQTFESTVDRTRKLVYALDRPSGPATIEVGVIDKQDGKNILCVPTQTNCAQACKFCHTTGMAGKVAVLDLTADEMYRIVRQAFTDGELWRKHMPLLVSFMGVGEPMANAANLLDAMYQIRKTAELNAIQLRFGLATMLPAKHVPAFKTFTDEVAILGLPVKVHLSLHYTHTLQRNHWMPAAAPVGESLDLLETYRKKTKNPVEIHYTLIQGVNDYIADAATLRNLLINSKIPVKFLHYNPLPNDKHQAPNAEWTQLLRDILEDKGIPTEYYESPGADIAASCGMFMTDLYVAPRPEQPAEHFHRIASLVPPSEFHTRVTMENNPPFLSNVTEMVDRHLKVHKPQGE